MNLLALITGVAAMSSQWKPANVSITFSFYFIYYYFTYLLTIKKWYQLGSPLAMTRRSGGGGGDLEKMLIAKRPAY